MAYQIGIDVGGTFTDFLLVDERGEGEVYKVLSTPRDPSIAFLEREGVEAVAVCFMHAYLNPAHEEAAAAMLQEGLPGRYLTLSSRLLPQIRLYDRVSTTVMNSYVGPIIERYLKGLLARLEEAGFGGVLLIMQSNGGVTSPEVAIRSAASALLSGPASGPVAARLRRGR